MTIISSKELLLVTYSRIKGPFLLVVRKKIVSCVVGTLSFNYIAYKGRFVSFGKKSRCVNGNILIQITLLNRTFGKNRMKFTTTRNGPLQVHFERV
jgi:hypothetical protein